MLKHQYDDCLLCLILDVYESTWRNEDPDFCVNENFIFDIRIILDFSSEPNSVLLILLFYLIQLDAFFVDKNKKKLFLEKFENISLLPKKIFLGTIILASKILSDFTRSTSFWAKLSNIPVFELLFTHREILIFLEYNVIPTQFNIDSILIFLEKNEVSVDKFKHQFVTV